MVQLEVRVKLMLEGKDLIEGNCYFALFYHDKDLKVPDIRTFIYVGESSEAESNDSNSKWWSFVDAESYLSSDASNKNKIQRFDNESLFSIFDLGGLIDELSRNKECQDKGEIFN